MTPERRFAPAPLRAAIDAICRRAGSAAPEAALVAGHLVEANLMGHDSHGVGMMPRYVAGVRAGTLKPNQAIRVELDGGALCLIDGNFGYGQSIAVQAMDHAIARARTHGVSVTGLRNTRHVGRVGAYGEQAARAGMVSVHFCAGTAGVPIVAPFGGAEGRFLTNPFCVAIPREGHEPVVLDFATSRIAMGKVRVARNQGKELAPGCIIDAAGRPSVDPNVMYSSPIGALLPTGEHKGSGLALACELLAGALTGGRMVHRDDDDGDITNNMFSIVIDHAKLGTGAAFNHEAEAIIAWVKSAKAAPGVDEVLVAGEPERIRRAARSRDGIPVDTNTWGEITAAAESLGLARVELERIAGGS